MYGVYMMCIHAYRVYIGVCTALKGVCTFHEYQRCDPLPFALFCRCRGVGVGDDCPHALAEGTDVCRIQCPFAVCIKVLYQRVVSKTCIKEGERKERR